VCVIILLWVLKVFYKKMVAEVVASASTGEVTRKTVEIKEIVDRKELYLNK
jgi:hypothetical protein